MKKRLLAAVFVLSLVSTSVFADDSWTPGKPIVNATNKVFQKIYLIWDNLDLGFFY